jgi:hypothetical protein
LDKALVPRPGQFEFVTNLDIIEVRLDDLAVLSHGRNQFKTPQCFMSLIEPDGAPIVGKEVKLLTPRLLNRTRVPPFGQVIPPPERYITWHGYYLCRD